MLKLNRNYSINVELNDFTNATIAFPLTVEFNITRKQFAAASESNIKIFNLSEDLRGLIRKDYIDWGPSNWHPLEFKAGYGETLFNVYKGNIMLARSYRENVDYITDIYLSDTSNMLQNSTVEINFNSGTSFKDAVEQLVAQMKSSGIKKGKIGNIPGEFLRKVSMSGNPKKLIDDLSGGRCFFDNGNVYILNDDEATSDPVLIINSGSGLIGTPMAEMTFVTVTMLFEPSANLMQRVFLDTANKHLNKYFTIREIHHFGTISGSQSGNARTTLKLSPTTAFEVPR